MRVTHASQMKPLVERAKTEGVERDRNSGHQPSGTRVEASRVQTPMVERM